MEKTQKTRTDVEKVKRLLSASGVRRESPLLGREPTSLADLWDGLLEGIPRCVRGLISISRDLPGLNELNPKDFTCIINTNLFNYYLLAYTALYIEGENYNMLGNSIQYTRYWMTRVIGPEMTEALFEWTKRFNELGLTHREIALQYPIVLTTVTKNSVFEEPATISTLHEYFYRALLYEFDLNNRNSHFISLWKDVRC